MRCLGVDYGLRRIGLAVADHGVILPLKTLNVANDQVAARQIAELSSDQRIDLVVLGLPVRLNGSLSLMAKRVKRFGHQLSSETGLRVVYSEEQLTSQAASQLLSQPALLRKRQDVSRRRGLRDQAAAVLILRDYLDYV